MRNFQSAPGNSKEGERTIEISPLHQGQSNSRVFIENVLEVNSARIRHNSHIRHSHEFTS